MKKKSFHFISSILLTITILSTSCQKQIDFTVPAPNSVSEENVITSNSVSSYSINIEKGLVAYYPFNGDAKDASNNKYNGVVTAATLTSDRNGKLNSAYLFNGTSAFIDIPTKIFDNGWVNSTVALWFNAYTHQSIAYYGGQTLFNTNCFNGFALGYSYQASKRIYVYKSQNDITGWNIASNDNFNFSPVNLNTWYFITVVKSGLNYTYYVNGIVDRSFTSSITPTPNTMYPIRIGGVITPLITDNRELFTGKIDDIRIYNRALTQQEITYLAKH